MFDDDTLWRRRTRMFGHRSAQHAWLWERSWGKVVILSPILFWLGFLVVNGVVDRGEAKRLKASWTPVCILEASAAACDQAVKDHHFTCFNVAEQRTRGSSVSRYDEARYGECMGRRMNGLSATPPRPRAE